MHGRDGMLCGPRAPRFFRLLVLNPTLWHPFFTDTVFDGNRNYRNKAFLFFRLELGGNGGGAVTE